MEGEALNKKRHLFFLQLHDDNGNFHKPRQEDDRRSVEGGRERESEVMPPNPNLPQQEESQKKHKRFCTIFTAAATMSDFAE